MGENALHSGYNKSPYTSSLNVTKKFGQIATRGSSTTGGTGALRGRDPRSRIQAKIAAPRPMNLPSLRRENSGLESTTSFISTSTTSWGSPTLKNSSPTLSTGKITDGMSQQSTPGTPGDEKMLGTSPGANGGKPAPRAWAPVVIPVKENEDFPTAAEAQKGSAWKTQPTTEPTAAEIHMAPSRSTDSYDRQGGERGWDELETEEIDFSVDVVEFADGTTVKVGMHSSDEEDGGDTKIPDDPEEVVTPADRFTLDYDRNYPPQLRPTSDYHKPDDERNHPPNAGFPRPYERPPPYRGNTTEDYRSRGRGRGGYGDRGDGGYERRDYDEFRSRGRGGSSGSGGGNNGSGGGYGERRDSFERTEEFRGRGRGSYGRGGYEGNRFERRNSIDRKDSFNGIDGGFGRRSSFDGESSRFPHSQRYPSMSSTGFERRESQDRRDEYQPTLLQRERRRSSHDSTRDHQGSYHAHSLRRGDTTGLFSNTPTLTEVSVTGETGDNANKDPNASLSEYNNLTAVEKAKKRKEQEEADFLASSERAKLKAQELERKALEAKKNELEQQQSTDAPKTDNDKKAIVESGDSSIQLDVTEEQKAAAMRVWHALPAKLEQEERERVERLRVKREASNVSLKDEHKLTASPQKSDSSHLQLPGTDRKPSGSRSPSPIPHRSPDHLKHKSSISDINKAMSSLRQAMVNPDALSTLGKINSSSSKPLEDGLALTFPKGSSLLDREPQTVSSEHSRWMSEDGDRRPKVNLTKSNSGFPQSPSDSRTRDAEAPVTADPDNETRATEKDLFDDGLTLKIPTSGKTEGGHESSSWDTHEDDGEKTNSFSSDDRGGYRGTGRFNSSRGRGRGSYPETSTRPPNSSGRGNTDQTYIDSRGRGRGRGLRARGRGFSEGDGESGDREKRIFSRADTASSWRRPISQDTNGKSSEPADSTGEKADSGTIDTSADISSNPPKSDTVEDSVASNNATNDIMAEPVISSNPLPTADIADVKNKKDKDISTTEPAQEEKAVTVEPEKAPPDIIRKLSLSERSTISTSPTTPTSSQPPSLGRSYRKKNSLTDATKPIFPEAVETLLKEKPKPKDMSFTVDSEIGEEKSDTEVESSAKVTQKPEPIEPIEEEKVDDQDDQHDKTNTIDNLEATESLPPQPLLTSTWGVNLNTPPDLNPTSSTGSEGYADVQDKEQQHIWNTAEFDEANPPLHENSLKDINGDLDGSGALPSNLSLNDLRPEEDNNDVENKVSEFEESPSIPEEQTPIASDSATTPVQSQRTPVLTASSSQGSRSSNVAQVRHYNNYPISPGYMYPMANMQAMSPVPMGYQPQGYDYALSQRNTGMEPIPHASPSMSQRPLMTQYVMIPPSFGQYPAPFPQATSGPSPGPMMIPQPMMWNMPNQQRPPLSSPGRTEHFSRGSPVTANRRPQNHARQDNTSSISSKGAAGSPRQSTPTLKHVQPSGWQPSTITPVPPMMRPNAPYMNNVLPQTMPPINNYQPMVAPFVPIPPARGRSNNNNWIPSTNISQNRNSNYMGGNRGRGGGGYGNRGSF